MSGFSEGLGGATTGLLAGLPPTLSVAAGDFVASISEDLVHGRSINWGRALLCAGIGGLTGSVLKVVCAVGARQRLFQNLIDDVDEFEDAAAIGFTSIDSSFRGSGLVGEE